jgi:hypothetical protein
MRLSYRWHPRAVDGDDDQMQEKRDQAFRIYLFYLVGVTLYTDKSATYVDVTYMKYLCDLER